MKRRALPLILSMALAALLASCGIGGGQLPNSQLASVEETVEAANTLMTDVVSIVAGFGTNPLFTDPGLPDCYSYDCGLDVEVAFQTFPYITVLFYEYDAEYMPTNYRLATGIFEWDDTSQGWAHSPASDSLVFRWSHAQTDEPMEARVDWDGVVKARTYDSYIHPPAIGYMLPFYIPSGDLHMPNEELDVPTKSVISLKKGSNQLLNLEVTQDLANTSCGVLAEYTKLSASGFLKSGGQVVELDTFELDHSTDAALSVKVAGRIASGSLSLPFSLSAGAEAGSVTRSSTNCQLDGVEGPFSGSVDLDLGSQASGMGLGFEWTASLVEDSSMGIGDLAYDSARIRVGNKHVEIGGALEEDEYGQLIAENVVLTFLDRENMPVLEFLEKLDFPEIN